MGTRIRNLLFWHCHIRSDCIITIRVIEKRKNAQYPAMYTGFGYYREGCGKMSKETIQQAKELVAKMTLSEKMGQMLYESPAIERLGIPAYNWWNEALHGVARAGVATVFPQAIGMAASFDEKLIQETGDIVSTEGRAKFNEFSRRGDHGIYKG